MHIYCVETRPFKHQDFTPVLRIKVQKMGKKKKPYIDKKNAVSFHLVHRSQRDPLQADDESSKHVLMPLASQNEKVKNDVEKQKEEERQFGIFYDDEYDYMQHVRAANPECVWQPAVMPSSKPTDSRNVRFADDTKQKEKPKLQLPAAVFPSQQEDEVGLLNKAAPISGPRLDLDPDVVAAMDEDFNFEDPDNQLDDDFVLVAQGGKYQMKTDNKLILISEDAEEDDSDEESGEDFDSDELDDLDDDDQRTYNSDETKSRFTSYSLTSSVIRRTDGLTLLDDRFEKVFEEYDDMEIGALDHDEIGGHIPEQGGVLEQVLGEFEEAQKVSTLKDAREAAKDGEDVQEEDSDDDDDELVKMSIEEPNKERWDCESILSTHSNLYNHPKTIKEPSKKDNKIKLSQKTGMPLNVLPKPGPTKKQLEREMVEETRLPAVVIPRQKGQKETAEERKQRKLAVKMDRRERRIEKKFNKQAFKEEEKRQGKVIMNLKQNLQGIKMV
ncbi:protein LTV1 homolog [Amphiura filiformis]|uniref:protein LTV1 homolog n=1 Tax=Amphiura filiformis TaxID=82378 RepID=UPI003B2143C2